MKKLLALVLALVMTLGLATVGTNAAATKFGDDASIKYTEAAAVMSAIGVFDGDDSSNFRPTETLKRSEAAKIVAYLMLTKKTADGLVATGSRYNDVPANHWAAGYIEYLTSAGVLGGVGDGKFNPDGDIATVDFAKMLLVALGFDAKIENLVLSDYRINTIKLANEVKLFDGNNDVVATNAITRDEASLYAFNLVKTPIVEYDNTTTVTTGNDTTVKIGNGKAHKKTTEDGSQSKQTISYENEGEKKYFVEFGEQYYPDLELIARDVLGEVDYSRDDMGRPVRKWSYKKVDLGTYALNDSYLLATYGKKVERKQMYDLLGKSTYDNLVAGRSDLYVYFDGWSASGYDYIPVAASKTNSYLERTNSGASNKTDDGVITEVYRDKDGNVSIISYNEYVFQVVADYNSSSQSVRVSAAGDHKFRPEDTTLKLEDYPQIADLKADDYVLLSGKVSAEGSTTFKTADVKKATVLSGEVSTYTVYPTSDTTKAGMTKDVTISGEKKEYAAYVGTDVHSESFSIGKNATVILNSVGYIVAVDEAVVVTDYVLIRKWGTSNSSLNSKAYADAIFSDGTSAEIQVKEAATYVDIAAGKLASKTNAAYAAGDRMTKGADISGMEDDYNTYRWYAYSKNSSGEYTLSAVNKNYTQSYAAFNKAATEVLVTDSDKVAFIGTTTMNGGGLTYTSVKANDKTVMVLRDKNDDLYVYSGVKNLAKVTLNAAAAASGVVFNYDGTAVTPNLDAGVFTLNNKSGFAIAAYVEVNTDAGISGSANDNLIFVRDYQHDVKNSDKTWYNYRVINIDATTDNVTADSRINANGGTFYVANYASRNKDGNLTNFTAVPVNTVGGYKSSNIVGAHTTKGGVTWSNGTLAFSGVTAAKTAFSFDKDSKVLLIKLKSEADLLTDKGATYEAIPMTGTGKSVADESNDRTDIEITYVVRTSTESSSLVREMFVIFGKEATSNDAWASSADIDTWITSNKAKNGTYYAQNGDVDIEVNNSISGNLTIRDARNVTIDSNVSISGSLTIEASGTVTINGHVVNSATGKLYINGEEIDINGNSLVNSGEATLWADVISIYGNLTSNSNSTLYLSGKDGDDGTEVTAASKANIVLGVATVVIEGNLTTYSGSTLNMSGATVGIDGNLVNSATVTGTGTIDVSGTHTSTTSVPGGVTVKGVTDVTIDGTTSAFTVTGATKSSQVTVTIDAEVTGWKLSLNNTSDSLPSTIANYSMVAGSIYGIYSVVADTSAKVINVLLAPLSSN